MPNLRDKHKFEENFNDLYGVDFSSENTKKNVQYFMKRLKDTEQKKTKENFFFVVSVISVLIISGIVITN